MNILKRKVVLKLKNTETETEQFEQVDSTQIELITDMTSVHSPIKNKISKDFIYGKFEQLDSEGVSNAVTNGDMATWVFDYYMERFYRYRWVKEKNNWEKCGLTNEEENVIKKIRNRVFDAFMVRPYMTAVLSRNKELNYMLRHITKVDVSDGDNYESVQNMGRMQKFLEKFRNQNDEQ